MTPLEALKAQRAEYWEDVESDRPWHAKRWAFSFQWITQAMEQDQAILELGESSSFTEVIKPLCGELTTLGDADLRYQWPVDSGIYDGLVAMEILEHICDQNPRNIDEAAQFNRSGADNFVAEAFRVIKPGGWMFLSTPNVCSSLSMMNMINADHPHAYAPHHREYPPGEVRGMLKQIGFRLERNQLIDVYGRSEQAKKFIQKHGLQHRGDTFFILARKDDQPDGSSE